ncbi:MAG: NAD(P)-binding protein [Gammaproteobacteria bacterium]|nr:NAD(P)-binding protein [Gammaproteobacteria bacterium]MDE0412646.1 NAD(P)-binding protein [Gammaproteobacteria bacterium]
MAEKLTFRLYEDGDHITKQWSKSVVQNGLSEICPTYIHRTPPCQASCPSGHDIRGWLSIVRGIDKPVGDMTWQEHAFWRMTSANPFPSVMGRVCPAPCEDGCNRNEVEEAVGINAVEQYVGDWALKQDLTFSVPEQDSGKKVAIIGGGCAGLTAAYFLRKQGHACTIFDEYDKLGGMMVFGIPGYRTPRSVLDGEINRIIDMGVEVKLNTRVGTDVSVEELERDYDAILWGIGAVAGKKLPIPGGDAPNVVDGMSYLRAFNEDRLKYISGRILVIGAGDTAMDVLAVARRIGNIKNTTQKDRPENVILGYTVHDVASIAKRQGADVWVVYRRPISQAPATQHELDAVIQEGVEIHDGLSPIEVIKDEEGRAKALRVVPVEEVDGKLCPKEGEEFDIECTLIVSATGQTGDYTGIEEFDNGRGLMDADKTYQVAGKPGHFVAGDAINPHLLTTAIGQASIAAESLHHYLMDKEIPSRPKIDTHHFKLLEELRTRELEPTPFDSEDAWGTDSSNFAIHNYEDRSKTEIATHDQLHLAYFEHELMNRRQEANISAESVLNNFQERFSALEEQKAIDEAARCMSCGMCFECDNCVVYCPEDAIFRVKKDQRAMGRYVDTDYDKCVGCHICADVCPSGYIKMGLTY